MNSMGRFTQSTRRAFNYLVYGSRPRHQTRRSPIKPPLSVPAPVPTKTPAPVPTKTPAPALARTKTPALARTKTPAPAPPSTVKNAAIVFITPTNRTILVKMAKGSDKNKWALPGGKIDPGETPYQAALREFMEETSLTIDETKITNVREYVVIGYSTVIYLLESTQRFAPYNKHAVKNDETSALVYISMADLSDLVFHRIPWGDVKELRNFETFRRLFVKKLIQA